MRNRTALAALLACSLTATEINAQTTRAMRYSVQIAALGSMELALEAGSLWASPGVPVYVVPIEVEGRTFYRVMAGMLATREEAVALMSRLVEDGTKESANAWDIKDANLAFALGTHPSQTDAQRARDEARLRGVPAYIIPAEENGGLIYQIWAGGFANAGEAAVLQGLLSGQGGTPALLPRTGLDAADARTLADRQAPEESEQPEPEPAGDPPPEADPPVQREPPPAEPTEQDAPSPQTPAELEPTPTPDPEERVPSMRAGVDSYNFTSIFVGVLGTATEYGGPPSAAGPRGYGGAILAGLILGGSVELGAHAGVESVSEDGAFGTGASSATVLTYSGFGGLYAPALGVGGASVRLGARGGWGRGSGRVTVNDQSSTVDLDTGVFVEPVLKAGFGSLGLIGAFRYFVEDTSTADWTASLGIIWGT